MASAQQKLVASGRDCGSLKCLVLYLSLSQWTGRRFLFARLPQAKPLAATLAVTMKFQTIILMTTIILTNCSATDKNEKSMTTELDTISYQDLLDKSFDYLTEQQEICKDKYKISTYKNWFYDQETGELTFSDDGIKKLIIKYENVGTVSLKSNTWLWAWANPNTLDQVKSEVDIVKDYGDKREF